MPAEAQGLACTTTQLLYLLALREAQQVIGLDDPLAGKPEADMLAELDTARDELARRGFIALHSDGSISIDYEVARLIDAIARPKRTVVALRVASGLQRRLFFVRDSVLVQVEQHPDACVQLVPLEARQQIADGVLDLWAVDDCAAAAGETVVLPQEALHAAARRAASESADAAADELCSAGAPPTVAQALAATLAEPIANGALLVFRGTTTPTPGTGMLAAANGLWRLRPGSSARVEVAPCSGAELRTVIEQFIRSATAT